MFSKLKRIATLVLCLVVLSALGVSVFAVNVYPDNQFDEIIDYDDGNTTLTVHAKLDRYYSIGSISVETYIDTAYVSVSVEGRYLDKSYDDVPYSYSSFKQNVANVGISQNTVSMYRMEDATYNFGADIPTSYTWQVYEARDIYFIY